MSDIQKYKNLIMSYQRAFTDNPEILTDLRARCYGKASSFSLNSNEMAFREGMRAVLLHIETMLTLDINQIEEREKQNDGQS